MNPYQYTASIKDFFSTDENYIIGVLTQTNAFDSKRTTIASWKEEINTLKVALKNYRGEDGFVAFEYTIPRVDGRVDCIIGLRGILFVLEFKTGETQDINVDKEQLMQYVIDLKNYHFESYDIPIAPMWVVPNANVPVARVIRPATNENIFDLMSVSDSTISDVVGKVLSSEYANRNEIDANNWLHSPYCPTANIVEAARKLYANHKVEDINRSDARGEDLVQTTKTIIDLINQAKARNEKYLCIVTGVPGAGKTLIGLSVATLHQNEEQSNRSVYLSGNRPLVMVLQEALARDARDRSKEELEKKLATIENKNEKKAYRKAHKVNMTDIRSRIKQFIQPVPNWRKEYLKGILVSGTGEEVSFIKDLNYQYKGEGEYYIPYDHVSIYDEAQRAWEAKENASYVRKKEKHLYNFPDWSEPRFLISCMDRHPDWAVYICLIGNGQDINHGEAGTAEWIRSIKHFDNWKTFAPSDILNDTEVAKEANSLKIEYKDHLHLSTDLRSIRAENLAALVDAILCIKVETAKRILPELERYPIRITRDLKKAKQWVKENARPNERYGALASSKGQRLKPEALILLPANSSETEVIPWFLGDKKNVNSSFYMEDVATEFQVQGLEIDWAVVAWDADFRYTENGWKQYQFRGSKWMNINKEEIRRYQINAYRVILTRARRGMVIYVPEGNNEDHTRKCEFYNSTYNYFKEIGIKEI